MRRPLSRLMMVLAATAAVSVLGLRSSQAGLFNLRLVNVKITASPTVASLDYTGSLTVSTSTTPPTDVGDISVDGDYQTIFDTDGIVTGISGTLSLVHGYSDGGHIVVSVDHLGTPEVLQFDIHSDPGHLNSALASNLGIYHASYTLTPPLTITDLGGIDLTSWANTPNILGSLTLDSIGGTTLSQVDIGLLAVPEPASLSLLGLGCGLLLKRRK